MPPLVSTAARWLPSAEEATDVQALAGALVCVQVLPELVQMPLPAPLVTTATRLLPLADEATEYQVLLDAFENLLKIDPSQSHP